ncbi:unnamed protein product [Hymenolepis diminuta]|uniref:Uncharacterized protein n=1 Tax=Hymenolepis diminuta TaxID=6216 RepID=A0A564Z9B3_HYMDI|nr:unnamed protein product [Hymenolepis diminuta]
MVADPRVLTDLNITNHPPMPFFDNHSCPSGKVFFGSIASCTIFNFRPINTSAGDFSPNAGYGIDLCLSMKFCSTSFIFLSSSAFYKPLLANR